MKKFNSNIKPLVYASLLLCSVLFSCSKKITQEKYMIGKWATLKRNDSLIKIDYYPVILQNKDSLFITGSVSICNPKTHLIIIPKGRNKAYVFIDTINVYLK